MFYPEPPVPRPIRDLTSEWYSALPALLDLAGRPSSFTIYSSQSMADSAALYADWRQVGYHIRKACSQWPLPPKEPERP